MTNYPEFVKAIAKPLGSQNADLNHAYLGIIGEIGELADAVKRWTIYENPLNEENVIEELGNLRFYMQMLINNNGYIIGPQYIGVHRNLDECVFDMAYFCGMLVGDESSQVGFANLYAAFLTTCKMMNVTEENVIHNNVAKLIKRYPEGKYTNKDANERKDKLGQS